MQRRHVQLAYRIATLLVGGVAVSACGARTGLGVTDDVTDAAVDVADAPMDIPFDVPMDTPLDRPIEAPFPDECEDPETQTYIYVFTGENELHAFKPESNTFERRGILDCPAGPGASPFSMAVSRSGIAYVLYNNVGVGEIYRASVLNAACEPTPFIPGQQGFWLFGMGFEPNREGEGESLHVVEINFQAPPLGLARIDLDTFLLQYIGPLSQNPGYAIELTPTGDGPLAGYFINEFAPGGTVVEIDTLDGTITRSIQVDDVGTNSSSLAVAWWGGAYYIFVDGVNGGTEVNRYDPVSGTSRVVARFGRDVVGAGVSTCAPAALP